MSDPSGRPVSVIGGGVVGLAVAVELLGAGAQVDLFDPAPLGDNASGVAAGMLAPALEALLDPPSQVHYDLLRDGRDAWGGLLAERSDLFDPAGSLFLAASEAEAETAESRFAAMGAPFAVLDAAEARARTPGLAADQAGVWLHLPGDIRVDPAAALVALDQRFSALGGRRLAERVRLPDGRLTREDGAPLEGRVVIAAGAEAVRLAAAAPELAALTPIKGQILQFDAGPRAGAVVRTRTGYVAPQPGGAVAGATMEVGRDDRATDPQALAALRAGAAALFPVLAGAPARGLAGVRASTPDGLPLVGVSAGPEAPVLAVGVRRNGWLLAPLVAALVREILSGQGPGPHAGAMSPQRFMA